MRGGVEGDDGDGGADVTGFGGIKLSAIGPLLAESPLVNVGAL